MNAEKWIIVYGRYEGLEKRAVELLSAGMQPYLKKVVIVKRAEELTDKEKAEVVADFIAVMSKSYISKKFYRYKLVRKKQCSY
jgi:hypothetical protein